MSTFGLKSFVVLDHGLSCLSSAVDEVDAFVISSFATVVLICSADDRRRIAWRELLKQRRIHNCYQTMFRWYNNIGVRNALVYGDGSEVELRDDPVNAGIRVKSSVGEVLFESLLLVFREPGDRRTCSAPVGVDTWARVVFDAIPADGIPAGFWMNGHFEYGDRIVLYQQSVAVAALSESDDYAVVAHFGLRQCSNCYQILPCEPWSYDTCSCETAVYCNGLCRRRLEDLNALTKFTLSCPNI